MPQEKLKIAFIAGEFPAIPEQGWFIDQLTGLIDMGVDIKMFVFKRKPANMISERTKRYHLLDLITYMEFPKNVFLRLMKAVLLFLKVLFLRPALLLRIFDVKKYGSEAFSLKYLFWIAPLVGKIEEYEVIHCHLGMIANRFLKIKEIMGLNCRIIATFYGQDSSKYIKAKGIKVYDQLKKEGNYILTMTREMNERLIGLGFPREKMAVHYTAVDPGRYPFVARKYRKGEVLKMLFVGSFVEKKGLEDVFRAMKELNNLFKNFELTVVGSGPDPAYNQKLKNMPTELGIEKYVNFKGYQTIDQIFDFYYKSHLMVQLSKIASNGDTDDLPFVLLEAQATGLPVVTTNHVGIPDGVSNGQSGFLVPEGDFKSAAEKILSFIKNPDRIEKFSQQAREFIVNNFDIHDYNERLIDLYKKLLDSNK